MTNKSTPFLLVCLLAFAGLITSISLQALSGEDDDDDLPPGMELMAKGEGRDETYYSCTACHSIRIVIQQGQDRKGWEDILAWMAEEQEMDPLDKETEKLVLDYLAKNYGKDRPNKPKPLK